MSWEFFSSKQEIFFIIIVIIILFLAWHGTFETNGQVGQLTWIHGISPKLR
jgi:hypothetical protein